MKTISLKSIEIKNFKGISNFSTTFTDRVEIYGRNGLGKTSILDAFLWCLFGKDSSGASSFSIKPLNSDGTIKDHHDVDVMCVLSIDGVEKSFRRKWIEKRSKKGDEYKGNEGAYFVNEAPIKEVEYSGIISSICREDLFKLITATGAFNRMKDADKRAVLSGMSDNFDDKDIAKDMPDVLQAFLDGKTLEQFKAEIRMKRSKAELELEQYPTRLKENADSRPVIPDDISDYPQKIEQLLLDIEMCENKLKGCVDHELVEKCRTKVRRLQEDLYDVERQCRKELNDKSGELNAKIKILNVAKSNSEKSYNSAKTMESSLLLKKNEHTQILEQITEEWKRVNESTVDATVDSVCPTCGKPFSEYDMEVAKNEIIRAFNEDKLKRLSEIDGRGKSEMSFLKELDGQINEYTTAWQEARAEIDKINGEIRDTEAKVAQLPTLASLLSINEEYQTLLKKLDDTRAEVKKLEEPTDDDISYIAKKGEAQAEVARLRKELAKLDEIKRLDERKEELEKKQREMGQLVADYKRIDAEILAFSMKKTSLIEQSVSDKFRLVRFKMFEYNLTNDGVREVCICTVNGVPYKDLNTAMQYNADIDIINALSSHYDIVAPVFIDRAESINVIEDTKGQRIDLYATKDDKTLRVEHIR